MMPAPNSAAAEPSRFSRRQVPADGASAAGLREEFSRWLRRNTDLEETGLCDVLLAVNEAVANSAEFAYLQYAHQGTVDLEATVVGATLAVTVADHGRWRATDPAGRQRSRGRGIPLMRTLADSLSIDSAGAGTTVSLSFRDVHLRQSTDVMV